MGMNESTHTHPNPIQYRLQQTILTIVVVFAIFGAIMLFIIALIVGLPLFAIMSILVIVLAAPALMGIINTPPVIANKTGLTIQTWRGREQHIAWDDITHITDYPLLPLPEHEIVKQWLVGRKKYRAAEGILLVIPSLGLPYRIAGFLAGQQSQPIIAFTNRNHTDYHQLKDKIEHYAPHAIEALEEVNNNY